MVPITFVDAPDTAAEALLDGRSYELRISWNETAQWWTLSMRNFDGDLLISGIRLRPNWPILYRFRSPLLPKGELIIDNPTNLDLDRKCFAEGRATLVYFTAQEMTDDGFLQYGYT